MRPRVCRCEGGGGGAGNGTTSLIFQTQERVSQAALMLSCRTGRERTLSEIPLKEVVIITCGRNQGQESSVALHNLPRTVSPNDHKQQRQTLLGLHQ